MGTLTPLLIHLLLCKLFKLIWTLYISCIVYQTTLFLLEHLIKYHLHRAQQRTERQADTHRSESESAAAGFMGPSRFWSTQFRSCHRE